MSVKDQKDVIDKLVVNPFIDGPTEALVKRAAASIAKVKEFRYIFGDNIDTYERFDYQTGQLPALRVYNHSFTKEHESHYIVGELLVDVIWPQTLRRDEQQRFQDILSAALLQQFRRPKTFQRLTQEVPGLNELGKVFSVNKELGMKWDEGVLPITEIRANFRIDLKQWDAYLESTGRTKDDPFEVTLADLLTVAAQIIPTRDDGSQDGTATVTATVKTQGE